MACVQTAGEMMSYENMNRGVLLTGRYAIAIFKARGGHRREHTALVLAYIRSNRVGSPSVTLAPPQCQTTSHRVLRAKGTDFPLLFIGGAVFACIVAAGAITLGLYYGAW